jgi:hypothetical protein
VNRSLWSSRPLDILSVLIVRAYRCGRAVVLARMNDRASERLRAICGRFLEQRIVTVL